MLTWRNVRLSNLLISSCYICTDKNCTLFSLMTVWSFDVFSVERKHNIKVSTGKNCV